MTRTRRFWSLTISLAIVLTIIGPTNGFTIRHRSNISDLAVEESSVVELKSEPDEINTPREDEPVTVIPIQRNTDPVTSRDDAGITEPDREATERTSVDKVPTEGTESVTTEEVVQTVGGISHKDWFETTMPLETDTEKVENDTETSVNYTRTSPVYELSTKDLDNIISAAEQQTILSSVPYTLTEPGTTLVSTTKEETKATEENITTEGEMTNTEPISTMSDPTQTHTTDTTTTTEKVKQTDTILTDTTPFWKKYTKIERTRVTNTDIDEKVETTPTERATDSINAHTTETRVSLEKAFDLVPEILSLQQLKTDLIKTTNAIGYRDGMDATNSIDIQTESIPPSTAGRITEDETRVKPTEEGNQIEMVSKRAGYLDHSKTTIFNDGSTINATRDGPIELDVIGYELDPDGFGTGNKTSQSQLAEDAMKEELLKESFINDKEETSMLYRTSDENKKQFADVATAESITEPIHKEHTIVPKVTDKLPEEKVTGNSFEPRITDKIPEQIVTDKLLEQTDTNNLPELKVTANIFELPATYTTTEQTIYSTQQTLTTGNPTGEKFTEDLSVKPISPEKKVTPNLYTVNPNYKPLKKLEIQPPKPFTRDPDDNSWRNESLSSLGIVFKAKNSSKAFTEVLKNKTEIEMNNLPEQNRTIEKIELRDRLEKIAEKRKSKKKKTDQFGNTEYTDYEENNNSGDQQTSKETPAEIGPLIPPSLSSSTEVPKMPSSTVSSTTLLITNPYTFANTEKPKKILNLQEYYDTSEEDDYVTLPKVDIMKATTKPRVQWPVTQSMIENTNPTQLFPERKPTVQYFPPRAKTTTDNVNEYFPPTHSTGSMSERYTESKRYPSRNLFYSENVNYASNENRNQPPAVQHIQYRPVEVPKSAYLTQPPKLPSEGRHEIPESYNRGFVIRHYKDLIDAAIKDNDYDRNVYPTYTVQPTSRVTANAEKTPVKSEEYDYDARKEVLDKFVDNFNQNHEQFKADFPVVFNTSIVHQHGPEGGKVVASSSAMFKRLYNDATATKANGFLFTNKPYDPNCENITVELSPAYELHYYVPDQEEREEQAVKVTLPYGYRI